MFILAFILGLAIGFIAGTGLWRKAMAGLGDWATTVSRATSFPGLIPVGVNAREKKR